MDTPVSELYVQVIAERGPRRVSDHPLFKMLKKVKSQARACSPKIPMGSSCLGS